jgi:hypothetical protein
MTEPIKIDNTGEMIAAIPAILGFVPSQSVVLVFLAGDRLSHIARMDFGEMDHSLVTAAISRSDDTEGVYVIVVAENRTFHEVLDESERVIAMLLEAGADVWGSFYIPSIIRELAELVSARITPDAALAARVGLLLTTDIHARDAILGLAVIDPNVASERWKRSPASCAPASVWGCVHQSGVRAAAE